jgi:hypothetical protein
MGTINSEDAGRTRDSPKYRPVDDPSSERSPASFTPGTSSSAVLKTFGSGEVRRLGQVPL